MRVERSPQSGQLAWIVHVDPGELELTATRRLPFGTAIGTINQRGTIRVWYPAASTPRTYGRAARFFLENVRHQLWQSGELRNLPEERRQREEARTGGVLALLDDGRVRRFHEALRAYEWAERELKKTKATRAELFRSHGTIGDVVSDTPFAALKKNEYGHVLHAGYRSGREGRIDSFYQMLDHAKEVQTDAFATLSEKIAAWSVAEDAAQEAGLTHQANATRDQKERLQVLAGKYKDRVGRFTITAPEDEVEVFSSGTRHVVVRQIRIAGPGATPLSATVRRIRVEDGTIASTVPAELPRLVKQAVRKLARHMAGLAKKRQALGSRRS